MFFYPLKIVGFNFRFRIKTSVVYFLYQTLPKKLSETSHQATILNSKNVWKFMKIKLYKDVSTVYCQVSKYEIVHFCSKKVHCTTLSSKITMFLQGSFPPTSYLDSFLNGLFNLQSTGFQNSKKESFTSIVADKLIEILWHWWFFK